MQYKVPHRYKIVRKIRMAWLRITILYKIIKAQSFVVIYITDKDLEALIRDAQMTDDINLSFYGCMQHQGFQAIKETALAIDDTDLICEKASFDADIEERFGDN